MNKLTLWTAAGGLQIVYPNSFVEKISKQVISNDVLHYPVRSSNMMSIGSFLDEMYLSQGPTIISKTVKLSPYHSISRSEYMSYNSNIMTLINDNVNKQILKELKSMVAQKIPTFFIKDLNMEALNKLSVEHAKNGSESEYGLHIDLNDTQKFFVIANPDNFCFYMTHFQNMTTNSMTYSGKLVNLREKDFIMGRYKNLIYMTELSAMQRYVDIREEV
jgi:hypothetical protein